MILRAFLFIALFSSALYINSISGEFIWDDQSFVADNTSIRTLANFGRFFTDNKTGAIGELANDVYRPLTTLSYAIDHAVWGLNSFGYHLTNIVLHSANAILVCILLLILSGNFFIAFFGSLIFASHPVQTEVVAWISGRSSVLFLLFFLSSLIFYIKFAREKKNIFYYLSLSLFALSLFSKEMSITLPFIIILYDMHFPSGNRLKGRVARYLPYFILSLFYVALRITLTKRIGQFEGWGSPYFVFLTMLNVVADYIRILVFPVKLCAVGYPIPITVSIREPRVILSIVTLSAILVSIPVLFRRNRPASFALLWFFITLLPVLNIIPIKALEAERFLYLPSIGFALLTAYAAYLLGERLDKAATGKATIVMLLAGVLIMGYSLKTILRAEEWKDEVVISNKTALSSPDSAWALTALGANLMERKNYTAAVEPLEKAVAICEGYTLARNALGECYLRLGRNREAVAQFIEVLKIDPLSAKTRNFLGVAYAGLKEYNDAEKQFTAALKKDPEFLNAHLNLGRLYEIRSEFAKAVKQYFMILEDASDPADTAVAHIRIGDCYLKMELREKAKTAYLKAREAACEASEVLKKIIEDKLKEL